RKILMLRLGRAGTTSFGCEHTRNRSTSRRSPTRATTRSLPSRRCATRKSCACSSLHPFLHVPLLPVAAHPAVRGERDKAIVRLFFHSTGIEQTKIVIFILIFIK